MIEPISPREMRRNPTHPGEVLREEFLLPLRLSQASLAKACGISPRMVSKLVLGLRPVTQELAQKLGDALKTTSDFWLNLQAVWDEAQTAREGQTASLAALKAGIRSHVAKKYLRTKR